MLIPANELYWEKKGFTWSLTNYNDDVMGLKVNFENPKYISIGGTDTLKVTLSNTKKYLQPENSDLETIPDGFTLSIKLPPQGVNLMSKE